MFGTYLDVQYALFTSYSVCSCWLAVEINQRATHVFKTYCGRFGCLDTFGALFVDSQLRAIRLCTMLSARYNAYATSVHVPQL